MQSPLAGFRKQNGLTLDALAVQLGFHKTTIMRWEHGRVPAERVLDIERLTGISRHDLRPDLHPREADVERPAASTEAA